MISGIIVRKYFAEAGLPLVVFCILLIILIYRCCKDISQNYIKIIFVCVIFALSGYYLCKYKLMPVEADKILYDGIQIEVEGNIFKQEQKKDKTILYLNNSIITVDSKHYNAGKVMLYLNEQSVYYEESHVLASGTLNFFRVPTNPGEFNEKVFYQCIDINYRIMGEITNIENDKASVVKTYLTVLKYNMERSFDRASYSESDASVLKAMILGNKACLDYELKELYQISGISHLISISGLHVSIIGMALYRILRKLRFNFIFSSAISLAVMISFGFMTGMSVSTIRALVMFILTLGAYILGRTYDIYSALSLAVIFVLMDNPLYLFYTGFQLSFLAIIGIVYFTPVVCEHFKSKNKIITVLVSGISIQVFTIPIILFAYYEIPLYAFLVNSIVIPLASLLMLAGIIGGVVGLFNSTIGAVILYFCHLVLCLYEKVCSVSQQIPNARIIVGKPSVTAIILFYFFLFIIIRIIKYEFNYLTKNLFIIISSITILYIVSYKNISDLEITFIDVGQGDSIYIGTDDNVNILIDGGSSSYKNVGKYKVLPFLKSKGVKELDYVITTHSDSDHINGIAEIIDADYCIKNLVIAYASRTNEEYMQLLNAAKDHGINIIYIGTGDSITTSGLNLNCIHPDKDFKTDDVNEASIVFEFKYKDISGILTGDLDGKVEDVVSERLSRNKYTFLKVAHHGSKNSSTNKFISLVEPVISIISCGKDNKFGHPHAEVLERLKAYGSRLYCTMNDGAVSIKIKDGNTYISKYNDEAE